MSHFHKLKKHVFDSVLQNEAQKRNKLISSQNIVLKICLNDEGKKNKKNIQYFFVILASPLDIQKRLQPLFHT